MPYPTPTAVVGHQPQKKQIQHTPQQTLHESASRPASSEHDSGVVPIALTGGVASGDGAALRMFLVYFI